MKIDLSLKVSASPGMFALSVDEAVSADVASPEKWEKWNEVCTHILKYWICCVGHSLVMEVTEFVKETNM